MEILPFDIPSLLAVSGMDRFAPGCTSTVSCTDVRVLELIAASIAPNTRCAYTSDLRHFLAWGATLPATPLVVARYLADQATQLSAATLARRLVAIGRAHAARKTSQPSNHRPRAPHHAWHSSHARGPSAARGRVDESGYSRHGILAWQFPQGSAGPGVAVGWVRGRIPALRARCN